MKICAFTFIALLMAVPLAAVEVVTVGPQSDIRIQALSPEPGRFSRMLGDYRAVRAAQDATRGGARIGRNAVSDSRAARSLGIPAAGAVHGAFGTYFHSDVTIVSYRNVPQDVMVFWAANGASKPTSAP